MSAGQQGANMLTIGRGGGWGAGAPAQLSWASGNSESDFIVAIKLEETA